MFKSLAVLAISAAALSACAVVEREARPAPQTAVVVPVQPATVVMPAAPAAVLIR